MPKVTPKPTFLPREGLTREALFAPLKHTALQPLVTGPLLYYILKKPESLRRVLPAALKPYVDSLAVLKWLKVLVGVGLARVVNNYLDRRVLNNFTSDEYDWDKEIVAVTGGSSGIGEMIVHKLGRQGVKVIVFDIAPAKDPLPSNAYFYKLDVRSSASIAEVAAAVRAEHGAPTVLINNAGVGTGKLVLDTSEAEMRRVFEVNTISHFLMCKEFLPAMIAANHGHVVTVASMASFLCQSHNVDYACSKASALAFHEGIQQELAHNYKAKKVRTTSVHPWWVKTPLTDGMEQLPGFNDWMLDPQTIADAVIDQLFKAQSGSIYLPERLGAVAPFVRSMPLWMQYRVRSRVAHQLARPL